MAQIDSRTDRLITNLREYFRSLGYVEIPSQCRTSILAACEDPKTMTTFTSGSTVWALPQTGQMRPPLLWPSSSVRPLPQTGQMQLEVELLRDPDMAGCYCITTSYRDEPNPTPGRHERVFPMFEFEGRGGVEELIRTEIGLLTHLGLLDGYKDGLVHPYEDVCREFDRTIIEAKEEELLWKEYGPVVFLTDFPQRSHPFWNMKRKEDDPNLYEKVDVLLYGYETIGSAERSTNIAEMRDQFEKVSDGKYAQMLFDAFTETRVRDELEGYFDLPLETTPRFGGGIGVTRLIRALELHNT